MPHQLVLNYLSSDKFRLQSNTLRAFQRKICSKETFKLLIKTLLKELFTIKGEILSCKSVKPCKNRKNSRAYYIRTRDKSIGQNAWTSLIIHNQRSGKFEPDRFYNERRKGQNQPSSVHKTCFSDSLVQIPHPSKKV